MTNGPLTLAIDVGGSGLKAVVLAPDGEMLSERVRRETPYPCTPPVLLDELTALTATQPDHDRVSVGFPGAVRRGHVRHVTAFVRPAPGERIRTRSCASSGSAGTSSPRWPSGSASRCGWPTTPTCRAAP